MNRGHRSADSVSGIAASFPNGREFPIRKALRRCRQCAVPVSLLSLTFGGAALAQDAGGDAAAQKPLEEVTVTGSRIRATGFSTPTPVTAVTANELEDMDPGNLITAMTQLPVFFNNTTQDAPGNFFNTPGSGSLNIRGLGTNRTLTLLNGRRMTPSNRVGSVDINSFPEELVERVEVVTGGASAAYGTDAVAGVANFILNTKFNGLKAHVQAGDSARNSRETWEAGAAFGTEIGKRSHLIVSGESYHQDGVEDWTKQPWYRSWGLVRDVSNPTLQLVLPDVVASIGSEQGVLSAPGLNPITFEPDGTPVPFVLGSPGSYTGGSHSITNGGTATLTGQERGTLSPDARRESAFLYYDFDVGDKTNVYVQGIYGQNESRGNNLGGTFTISNTLTVFSGNAFLPPSVQQFMDDNGLASMKFTRIGSDADLAKGAAQDTLNTSRTLTLGFDKTLSAKGMLDSWQLHGYVQWGRTERRGNQLNGIRIDRLPAALDAVRDPATGQIVCYAALQDPANWSDCVPVNLFGAGNASQAAIDYLTGEDAGTKVSTPVYFTDSGYASGRTLSFTSGTEKLTITGVNQDVAEFSMDGPIAKGWAGEISAAFGASYRRENILQLTYDATNPSGAFDSRPAMFDPTIVRGIPTGIGARTTAIQFASVPNLEGGFNVKEAFSEFIVPLVAKKPAVQQLTANLAYRWADYSGSGNIAAWKYGLDWQVNDLLRVRTTVSRDVRAATLAERFDRTGGISNVFDPMFNEIRPTSTATGGNPRLKPEEADTRTLGFVVQPPGAPGFQASIDWYDIDVSGAVGQLGAQAIVDECFNFPTSSSCGLMHRDPATGNITIVENVFVNINQARANGIDLETAYTKDVGPGSLSWRIIASKLNENSITNLGAPKVDQAGDIGVLGLPDFKVTTGVTYDQGPFTAFVQLRYIGAGILDSRQTEGVTISDNTVDSVLYTDARLTYGKDLNGGARWELFGAVTNLFDTDPPVVAGFSAFTLQPSQANASVHDVLGRRYTVGFRYSF